jgi:Spy/CpxP family protein refolding chaperone
MLKRTMLGALLVVAAGCNASPEPDTAVSPYAGQQAHPIKTLSAEEIEGYLAGEGMGLAKAAELNHYPGPQHVLALADELGLEEGQHRRTRHVFETMEADARGLGQQIVEKERALDALFADQDATEASVRAALREIGTLQADLRLVHLAAHLKMKDLLTDEQVAHYDQLRGYDASTPPGQHHPGEMHH